MVRFLITLPALASLLGLTVGCATPGYDVTSVTRVAERDAQLRVLCVVAHPDDAIAFAGTLFKTSTHLGGACDVLLVTDGSGGYKYSTLAERLYGVELTDPAVGRKRLPAIRRQEEADAARFLGVRNVYFLNQMDHRYTLDQEEVLAADAKIWDLPHVRATLDKILLDGNYDFVLTHTPVPQTHGHHKAASILALQAIERMPVPDRPVALGTFSRGQDGKRPLPPDQLESYPVTKLRKDLGPFVFDRTQKFGFKERLDYRVVVNWAITAHKSQGTMQTMVGRGERENYLVYALPATNAQERVQAWFQQLAQRQYDPIDFDEYGQRKAATLPADLPAGSIGGG